MKGIFFTHTRMYILLPDRRPLGYGAMYSLTNLPKLHSSWI